MTQLRIHRAEAYGGVVVELDGIDISDRLDGVHLTIDRNDKPHAFFSYKCHTAEFEGDVTVHHLCPLETPDAEARL